MIAIAILQYLQNYIPIILYWKKAASKIYFIQSPNHWTDAPIDIGMISTRSNILHSKSH